MCMCNVLRNDVRFGYFDDYVFHIFIFRLKFIPLYLAISYIELFKILWRHANDSYFNVNIE